MQAAITDRSANSCPRSCKEQLRKHRMRRKSRKSDTMDETEPAKKVSCGSAREGDPVMFRVSLESSLLACKTGIQYISLTYCVLACSAVVSQHDACTYKQAASCPCCGLAREEREVSCWAADDARSISC